MLSISLTSRARVSIPFSARSDIDSGLRAVAKTRSPGKGQQSLYACCGRQDSPLLLNSRAMAWPMPDEQPVMRTVFGIFVKWLMLVLLTLMSMPRRPNPGDGGSTCGRALTPVRGTSLLPRLLLLLSLIPEFGHILISLSHFTILIPARMPHEFVVGVVGIIVVVLVVDTLVSCSLGFFQHSLALFDELLLKVAGILAATVAELCDSNGFLGHVEKVVFDGAAQDHAGAGTDEERKVCIFEENACGALGEVISLLGNLSQYDTSDADGF